MAHLPGFTNAKRLAMLTVVSSGGDNPRGRELFLLLREGKIHRDAAAARPSASFAAAQIVSISRGDSRVSGCSTVHGPGILPADTSSHEAASSVRCSSGEYPPHSEKLTAFRPSVTPCAINQD